jgi:hypothetical protein
MYKFSFRDRTPNGKFKDCCEMDSSMYDFRRFHAIVQIQIEQTSMPTNLTSKKKHREFVFTSVTPGATEFRETTEPPQKSRENPNRINPKSIGPVPPPCPHPPPPAASPPPSPPRHMPNSAGGEERSPGRRTPRPAGRGRKREAFAAEVTCSRPRR